LECEEIFIFKLYYYKLAIKDFLLHFKARLKKIIEKLT